MLDNFKAYRITCIPNGKIYIGITSRRLLKRWAEHVASAFKGHPLTKLLRAIRKHGSHSFTIEHIASTTSYGDLLLAEIDLIAQYDSKNNGLNSTIGGDGVVGLEFSIESKFRNLARDRRVRERRINLTFSPVLHIQ